MGHHNVACTWKCYGARPSKTNTSLASYTWQSSSSKLQIFHTNCHIALDKEIVECSWWTNHREVDCVPKILIYHAPQILGIFLQERATYRHCTRTLFANWTPQCSLDREQLCRKTQQNSVTSLKNLNVLTRRWNAHPKTWNLTSRVSNIQAFPPEHSH